MDIRETALRYIREHGDRAAIHAAMEADEALRRGDIESAYSWRRVVNAVHECLSGRREGIA